jgi:predicted transposase YbfD/YdcC
MPACPSSTIPGTDPTTSPRNPDDHPDQTLLTRLDTIDDPRSPQGCIHPLPSILALVACATAAVGNDNYTAIGEWIRDAPPEVLHHCGVRRDPFTGALTPPSEATCRRIMTKVDPVALQAALIGPTPPAAAAPPPTTGPPEREARRARQRKAQAPPPPADLRDGLAVDGKRLAGARRHDGSRVNLLSAVTHDQGMTRAQAEIGRKTNEIPEAPKMLKTLNITDTVVTLDALHTQRATAEAIVEADGHYLMIIKENQTALLAAAVQRLRGTDAEYEAIGASVTVEETGHGRRERRTLRAAPAGDIDFPHAGQVLRIRRVTGATTGPWLTKQTVYGISDLIIEEAGPDHMMVHGRGHWSVENKSHYVRDVTFREDKSQIRTGHAPHAMAAIRNFVIATIRAAGHANIASARRWISRKTNRVLDLFNLIPEMDKATKPST